MPITILEPLENDDAILPVVVRAAYSFANTFSLICKVGTTAEAPPQSHSGEDVHVSSAITVPENTYTVFADGDNSAGNDFQPNVRVISNGLIPIGGIVIGTVPAPPEAIQPLGAAAAAAGTKHFKVSGECAQATKAKYVVCRIIEVDVATKTRTRVTSGASATQGNKLKWSLVVELAPKPANTVVYVAQITAHDVHDNRVGQITKTFKK